MRPMNARSAGTPMVVHGPALAVAALTLSLAGCASNGGRLDPRVVTLPPPATGGASARIAAPPAAGSPTPQGALTIRVRVNDARGTRVVTLPLEEYVLGAVRAELPPETLRDDAVARVLQVQAIVSRTYAVASLGRHAADHFDVCDGTHCQVYRPPLPAERPDDGAARAVADTRDEVLTYQGHVIEALFHSHCGGHTTSAGSVWGGPDQPYLRPVADSFCAATHSGDWSVVVSEPNLRRALNADARTAVGDRLFRLDVVSRDESGRAALMTLTGLRSPVVRAEEFRAVIGRALGPQVIRSTLFSVTRRGDGFVFSGIGYGHGVGLCQVGATLRARSGQSALDIVTHYFPGTRLESAALALALPRATFHSGEIP